MTFQERYNQLYDAYDSAGKNLQQALEKISSTKGFGDIDDIPKYDIAAKRHRMAEYSFQQMLTYARDKQIDPDREFLAYEYMYEVIKADQQKKGASWSDPDVRPKGPYECVISFTNDGEVNRMVQGTEYRFPVLNLEHGKECYEYLAKMLQKGGGDNFDVNKLDLRNIDQGKPIFIRVEITTWS